MKKSLLILLTFLLVCSVNNLKGQDTIRSTRRGWGTELNFNPFNGSLSLNNATGQIKLRKFLNDDIAIRVSFNINAKNAEDKSVTIYGPNPINSITKMKTFMTILSLGIEKHYTDFKKLSPYVGFEINGGIKTAEEDFEYNNLTKHIKGAWLESERIYNGQTYFYSTNYTERGFISAGTSVFTGFDFYMSKNFYFGYELGFGFDYKEYSTIEMTSDIGFPDTSNHPDINSKNWSIGPTLLNGIRIGYNF